MRKITPHLWFDTQAKDAAEFYTSVFPGSAITNIWTLHGTPSGDVDSVTLLLSGQEFAFISAGPLFHFTPAVSFLVACPTKGAVDVLWDALSLDGSTLMDLGPYPFSERYGWVQDKYGVSWQVMFMGERPVTQTIIPTMMFAGAQCGKAEEAINFYASVFHHSQVGDIMRYEKNENPDKEGSIKHASFILEGQEFAAMDSARNTQAAFNEAISFMVNCETQEEIDYYWGKLSADPKAEQCGWLKDKFGFSWQIVPSVMEEMLRSHNEKKLARVTKVFLTMKKFDIATLQAAYDEA